VLVGKRIWKIIFALGYYEYERVVEAVLHIFGLEVYL
jgi:hypothetical protein